MIKPRSWASREESLLLLNAYLDNELDAASALDVERRLTEDAALSSEHDKLVELRKALASQRQQERASDAFRHRIAEIARGQAPASRPEHAPFREKQSWTQLAAAAALGAIVMGGATYVSMTAREPSRDIAAMVSDHRRSLLAASPYDVASSDQHTVKPWFDSKIALSPQVVDLAAQGYPLAGGRVEILDGKPVPVIVYLRRAHVISVVAVPRTAEGARKDAVHAEARDGYGILRWQGRDFDYFAISDVAERELGEFVALWREATRDD